MHERPYGVSFQGCLFVTQVLDLRFFQFRWFVGVLSVRSKLRNTYAYERESGSYSPPF